jgi:hypothetical protein
MYLGSWSNVYLPSETKGNGLDWLPFARNTFGRNVVERLPFAGQFWIGVAAWPAIWQFNHPDVPPDKLNDFWHTFQRTPYENENDVPRDADGKKLWKGKTNNQLQADGDKTWDLGLIYTIIAGVLNILVIYDAFAGPAFRPETAEANAPREEGAAA